ncbi:MAG: magnesium transporter CorA family protein [Bacilli bacterium]
MINVYMESKGKLVSKKTDNEGTLPAIKPSMWISITAPNANLLKKVAKKTKINLPFLLTSLDSEESARIDKSGDDSLIVLDVPCEKDLDSKTKSNFRKSFTTIPFLIIYNSSYIVTISKKDTGLVDAFLQKTKVCEPHKHVRTTLLFLYALAQEFISYLKKIDAESKDVEAKLHSSMKNKELFDLMALNKMLVYFSTALSADKAVLERLMKTPDFKQFSDDYDLMEDVQVELNQAIEMCNIYRDILSGMMDAFASIISNNLNIVMKILAIVTIVLSVPTLVASFYGMNVKDIPLADNNNAFYVILAISAGLSLIAAVILFFIERRHRH